LEEHELKRILHITSIAFLLWTSAQISHAQAAPAATRSGSIQLGGGFSFASPDYGKTKIKGFSGYGDYDLTRHLGIEGDIHLNSVFTPTDIGEDSYLIGPRYVFNLHRFHPYAKFMGGFGRFKYQYDTVPHTAYTYGIYAFGGGVDYHLTTHLNIRPVDFEYQIWPGFAANGLTPMVWTFGAAYAFR
jgi:hypothetical protein